MGILSEFRKIGDRMFKVNFAVSSGNWPCRLSSGQNMVTGQSTCVHGRSRDSDHTESYITPASYATFAPNLPALSGAGTICYVAWPPHAARASK